MPTEDVGRVVSGEGVTPGRLPLTPSASGGGVPEEEVGCFGLPILKRGDVVSEDGGKTWYAPGVNPTRPGDYWTGYADDWLKFRLQWALVHGFVGEDGATFKQVLEWLAEADFKEGNIGAIRRLREKGWRDHEPVKGLGVFWYPDPEFGVKRGKGGEVSSEEQSLAASPYTPSASGGGDPEGGNVTEVDEDGCEEANR